MSNTVATERSSVLGLLREAWSILTTRLVAVGLGNTVCVDLRLRKPTEIELAGHRFWLLADPRPALVDRFGATHALRVGKNVIGRDRYNDVVIDARCHRVSGKHLMLESVDRRRALITDLSTNGTYVPPQCVI